MLTTVLAFLLTLAVLIAVHEYGHYKVARLCNVKVLRFSIGFGRVIWRRQANPDSTEFTLSALPLGGYVRMLDSREGLVAPAERALAFDSKPLRQRVAIVAAGPVANLLLAVLLFAVMHWIGTVEPRALLSAPVPGSLAAQAGLRSGDWVRATATAGGEWQDLASLTELRWRVVQATVQRQSLALQVTNAQGEHRHSLNLALDRVGGKEVDAAVQREIGLGAPYSEPVLGEVTLQGPAAQAGLQAGDRVLSVDGVPLEDAQQLRALIRASGGGRQQQWQVDRHGVVMALSVTPRKAEEGSEHIGRIDAYVGRAPETSTVRLGPVDGLLQGAQRVWDTAALSLRMMGRMLVGEASLRNLSGPLTIADYAGQSAQLGLSYYLGFLAAVSVSLGVLNLLPLPMLDGGLLMYYLFEGVTGRPVSDLWLKWLQRSGALVLLLMMSIALSNDVARLLGLQ
jgi:regulator of sigma E protease